MGTSLGPSSTGTLAIAGAAFVYTSRNMLAAAAVALPAAGVSSTVLFTYPPLVANLGAVGAGKITVIVPTLFAGVWVGHVLAPRER